MFKRLNRPVAVVLAAGIAFLIPSHGGNAVAETTCRDIFDPRYPGLEQCTARVRLSTLVASPPQTQKMSLWCWAASLSMIFGAQGHRISQDNIVRQNFGNIVNASGGDFLEFEDRLNRSYTDDDGYEFTAMAERIYTPDEAADALDGNTPLLYTTSTHATVQTSLTYQVAPGGPTAVMGGTLWDPWPGQGVRQLSRNDAADFVAAWAITTTKGERRSSGIEPSTSSQNDSTSTSNATCDARAEMSIERIESLIERTESQIDTQRRFLEYAEEDERRHLAEQRLDEARLERAEDANRRDLVATWRDSVRKEGEWVAEARRDAEEARDRLSVLEARLECEMEVLADK